MNEAVSMTLDGKALSKLEINGVVWWQEEEPKPVTFDLKYLPLTIAPLTEKVEVIEGVV